MKRLSFKAWAQRFVPITELDTFGEGRERARAAGGRYIWTVIDENDGTPTFIAPGYHRINSLHYIQTLRPWDESSENLRALYSTVDTAKKPMKHGDVLEAWYRNNRLHRDGGPALILVDGYQAYYKDGLLHRDDGPAVILANGQTEEWKLGLKAA